jgi:hypothetical protein
VVKVPSVSAEIGTLHLVYEKVIFWLSTGGAEENESISVRMVRNVVRNRTKYLRNVIMDCYSYRMLRSVIT